LGKLCAVRPIYLGGIESLRTFEFVVRSYYILTNTASSIPIDTLSAGVFLGFGYIFQTLGRIKKNRAIFSNKIGSDCLKKKLETLDYLSLRMMNCVKKKQLIQQNR
jgi:hypothetical protein